MTIIVGETERAALKAAMARAHTHPVPWEVLKRGITEHDGTDPVRVEDQPPAHERPPSGRAIARTKTRPWEGRGLLPRSGLHTRRASVAPGCRFFDNRPWGKIGI
jgi:hypothetical protein